MQNLSLIDLIEPNIIYYQDFIVEQNNFDLFNRLIQEVEWKEEYLRIFNRVIKCPRKIFWYGDSGINYKYSGISHHTLGWTSIIDKIRINIENFTNCKFNFVLLNYYADGHDYMGWHSDNEKSLGINPTIASVSLGVTRTMAFKNKKNTKIKKFDLHNNSLLIMRGNTQDEWLHSIPKDKHILTPRINLTFRYIQNNN